ncbi:competence protein CoiA family protein [Streptomyces sp. 5.8]|uniref:competence protein CoiA family protein n=1 Tax=Streptomyces sp. 5.8 TaxID=3406571 RepID=UPI003BB78BDC
MPFDEEDTRKVQTAVVGRSGSGWPVFLPYDHYDFDTFMRGRTREDFYCGVLLGGCGKKLTAKKYREKRCHFAHRPPVHCRRTANGESSADHLYIGQALQRWIRREGHKQATVAYPDLGSGPGGAVELRFASGARLIRVQMGRLPLQTWRQDRKRLDDLYTRRAHWAYGPDSGLAHNEVESQGHAIRFSCRTEGGTREVYVGTQLPDHAVEWATLSECRLTERGIATPSLARKPAPAPTTVSFPLAPGSIAFTSAVELPIPAGDATRLYEAYAQPLGSAVVQARILLPRQSAVLLPHLLYIVDGAARLAPPAATAHSGSTWLIRAESASLLARRTDPRWPDLRPPSPPAQPVTSPPGREPLTDEAAMVSLFRKKLEQIHCSHGIINWETLISHAGAAPSDFTPADRVRILVAVDSPRADGKPVLSARVKLAHDRPGPAPFFADVLAGLGLGRNLTDAKIDRIWRQAAHPEVRAEAPRHPTEEEENQLVGKLREHLVMVAKGRGVIKWGTLLKRQAVVAESVSSAARVRLLAAVDKPYQVGKPILSSLVKLDGQKTGPAPFFGEILAELGWKPDARTPTVAAAWLVERDRAYGADGHVVSPNAGMRSLHRLAGVSQKLGTDERRLVRAVRRTLIDAARRQVCVGWHTLAAAVGGQPGDFSVSDRLAVLAAVDRDAEVAGVMLSALVIGAGHTPVPYFNDILRSLGRPHGLRPIELGQVRKHEQARAFEAYREGGPRA